MSGLLRTNDAGQLIIRQSDLASFSYCGMRQAYDREHEHQGGTAPRLSATIYGSVVHHCLEVLQRLVHQGREDALSIALATFEKYWHPDHTAEVCEGPPTVWIAGQTWGGLKNSGIRSLTAAHEWMTGPGSKDILLATEISFDLPLTLASGEVVEMHGTLDRLALRAVSSLWYLAIDDWKTGVKPDHLQHAMQWTVYSWATEHPGFWQQLANSEGFDELEARLDSRGLDLYRTPGSSNRLITKRGRWFAVKNGGFSLHETGERGEEHYRRMHLAVEQYVKAQRADVHPITTDTKKCAYCRWAKGTPGVDKVCGDAPMPTYQIGIDDDRY